MRAEKKKRHVYVVTNGALHLSVFTLRTTVAMTVTVKRERGREVGRGLPGRAAAVD